MPRSISTIFQATVRRLMIPKQARLTRQPRMPHTEVSSRKYSKFQGERGPTLLRKWCDLGPNTRQDQQIPQNRTKKIAIYGEPQTHVAEKAWKAAPSHKVSCWQPALWIKNEYIALLNMKIAGKSAFLLQLLFRRSWLSHIPKSGRNPFRGKTIPDLNDRS